ncbi:hypothetical protein ACFWUW_07625 [Streptomyces sp. NPDC058655]|uniref:hypothetical protein n=1 Tax=unclassified Streptomyces TaxID=2593676 RepID=UPI00364B54F1
MTEASGYRAGAGTERGTSGGVRVAPGTRPEGPDSAARFGRVRAPAAPAGPSAAVRVLVEAIVRAVGAGDDALTGRLLAGLADIADHEALLHLRTRLYATNRPT